MAASRVLQSAPIKVITHGPLTAYLDATRASQARRRDDTVAPDRDNHRDV
jgi:hypothetical protein